MTVYAFGPYSLDTRDGELRRSGERIPLRPKLFQLLLQFLNNPGRLISKQELIDAVWADTHVEEGSLARVIADLRSALDDDPDDPRYVETFARRGYRFAATVTTKAYRAEASRFNLVLADKAYPLIEGENIIGRADECNVSLKLASISRRHAAVTIDGGHVTLRDLGSKNGAFVQGRRIRNEVDLNEGEEFRLGSVAMILTSASADRSTVTEHL